MRTVAIGIDVGGTGIKGAAIDLANGEKITRRHRVPTPSGGTPGDIAREVGSMVTLLRAEVIAKFPAAPHIPVGITLPGVVREGVLLTAANIDASWIGTDAGTLLSETIDASCSVVNDADAAGIAEARFGEIQDLPGTTMVLTFGTGIGTAFINDGVLVPNFELGHLQFDGHLDIEKHTAASAIARDGITITEWAGRVARYLTYLELLFHPNRFVIGGSISKKADEYLPFPGVCVPVTPAHFFNDAGIVGAAWLAHQDQAAL